MLIWHQNELWINMQSVLYLDSIWKWEDCFDQSKMQIIFHSKKLKPPTVEKEKKEKPTSGNLTWIHRPNVCVSIMSLPTAHIYTVVGTTRWITHYATCFKMREKVSEKVAIGICVLLVYPTNLYIIPWFIMRGGTLSLPCV